MPMTTSGRCLAMVIEGHSVCPRCGPAAVLDGYAFTTVWLSSDLVNFEQRVKIVDGSTKFFELVRPDIGVMLEDLRVRGDRQRMYLGKIEI